MRGNRARFFNNCLTLECQIATKYEFVAARYNLGSPMDSGFDRLRDRSPIQQSKPSQTKSGQANPSQTKAKSESKSESESV